jgi:hypothetical protein
MSGDIKSWIPTVANPKMSTNVVISTGRSEKKLKIMRGFCSSAFVELDENGLENA